MNIEMLKQILEKVKDDRTEVDDALEQLKQLPFEDLGFAKVDHYRNITNGYPEVVYCQGKTLSQIRMIVERLIAQSANIMLTRASEEIYEEIQKIAADVKYYDAARIVVVNRNNIKKSEKVIAVVSAGTSDIPVAEEAAVTAETMGNTVDRIYDVGVAGIHRLFAHADVLRRANVIIVAA